MQLETFFRQHLVDDFRVVDVCRLAAPEGFHPTDILSSSKVLILFAKEIPSFVFELDSKVKSFTLYQLIDQMDTIAYTLSGELCREGHESVPVPTFFPVRVHGGKLKGLLSLKHCAAAAGMGSLGLNTLLITKGFGNRLCLSGVVSAAPLDCSNHQNETELCLNCRKCIDTCPTKAITDDGVEMTRCVNFRNPVPKLMWPFLGMALKMKPAAKLNEIVVNILGWNTDMSCSRCLIICPHFKT